MKTKLKKVYYCDFCKKYRLTKNSMELHEKHCTLNPNRECRVCGNKTMVNKEDVEFIKKNRVSFQEIKGEIGSTVIGSTVIGIEKLKEAVGYLKKKHNCPMCIFSILRQALSREELHWADFQLKDEMEKYFEKENEENRYGY